MQGARSPDSGETDGKFLLNVDHIGAEFFDPLHEGQADRAGKSIAIDFFDLKRGTAQDAALEHMFFDRLVGGDDQDFMSVMNQPFPQDFHMGDHPVEIGKIGLYKDRDSHGSAS